MKLSSRITGHNSVRLGDGVAIFYLACFSLPFCLPYKNLSHGNVLEAEIKLGRTVHSSLIINSIPYHLCLILFC
ncbi:hypothetical protein Syun_014003 [Stephania yunnanensis]|uniref:Uncharacterized protein n=1 Tax=Stephania yunnanensis TaxID=152371 RepID=A0AAP0JK68_9MAGN